MLNIGVIPWLILSIVFYTSVAVVMTRVSAGFYQHLWISPARRRVPRIERKKLFSLFILNSMQTGLVVALAEALHRLGWGALYASASYQAGDIALIAVQVVLMLFVFDTQYYWLHRLFHENKRLYRWIHAEHHEVHFPTAWHLHYQSPLEWFLTTTSPMLILAVVPIPLSWEAYYVAIAISIVVNIGGHLGYEITGTALACTTLHGWASYLDPKRKGLARIFNNVLHHDLHHQRFRVNYSLYFTIWDRVCGSMDHDTDAVAKFVKNPS